ncbi:MAG: pyruvate dehydrogenase complex E1 component subunit beta [Flavobacteriales bacterium]
MKEVQFRQAVREAMSEEMKSNEDVFLMGEEVGEYEGAYKVTQGMLKEFGEKRVIDTPISELSFAGIGVGASMNETRPIVEFMTWNFALLAMDQVVNSAAKIYQMSGGQYNIPITFRGPNGQAGQLAATHSQSFEGFYAHVPGLKVITPSTPYDAKGLLKSAIRDNDPVCFLESEKMYGDKGDIPEGEYVLPIGKADIKKEGNDVTIITFGKVIKTCYEAADELEKEGYTSEIIDLRTIRPYDHQTIVESIKKTNRAVIVDESWPVASMGSELSHKIQFEAFDYLDAPIAKVNQSDTPFPFSPTLIEEAVPNKRRIMKAIRDVLYLN